MRHVKGSQSATILYRRIRGHLRIQAPAYTVFVGSLVLTLLAWHAVATDSSTHDRDDFDAAVASTSRAIDRRIDTYINAMYGARGLFTVKGALTPTDWSAFVSSSDLNNRYPGLQAFGYTPLVPQEEQEKFVAAVRREGNPDYTLQFEEVAPVYYPLEYIEPSTAQNTALLGYDMHGDIDYGIAMDWARDTGMPRASAKVGLPSQRGQPERIGFVIYLPVYRSEQPTSTVTERRSALQGFIVTIFAADDLAAAIFGPYADPQFDFEVFDGSQLVPSALLHDHDGVLHAIDTTYQPKFSRTTTLDVAGRMWTLHFTAPPTFNNSDEAKLPPSILVAGLCLSLMLFAITWLHGSSRAAAERIGAARADAIRELEAFSYSVSHDLRAPLRSINGFSQALLEDYGDRLDPQGHDYLNRVRAASDRMAKLIDALLDLSRLSRQETRRDWVDLSALAVAVADDLQQAHPERRVEWHLSAGLHARGDAKLLRIVLVNLLGNAWKFTGTVTAPRIELGSLMRDKQHVYFVRDNGVGFDMAYAGKLFGAFQRLYPPGEFAGTGIGLAIVQRAVHRHGGRVWAEGVPGHGATFFFSLEPTCTAERRGGAAWWPVRARNSRAKRRASGVFLR